MIKRVLRSVAGAAAVLGLAVVAAWILSRTVTDRWLWSQYLFWAPTVLAAAAAAALLGVSWVASRLGGKAARRPGGRARQSWGRSRGALLLGVAAMVAYAALVDFRVYGSLLRPRPAAGTVRILNWNATAVARTEQITGPVLAQAPDVAIIVNPHSGVEWHRVFEAFGAPLALAWDNGFIIMSRLPVRRYGTTWLGLSTPPPGEDPGKWRDPGRAMWLELDTTERLGRSTIVWVVDLPSDWRLPRRGVAERAAAAMRGWTGVQVNRDELGIYTREPGGPGFPEPDIVLGDFNTPRGSGSLALLAPGMENAYDQGGAGSALSWPRVSPVAGRRLATPLLSQGPLVHIDQMFLAPWLRARRYEVVDPGSGYHRMQVGEIAKR